MATMKEVAKKAEVSLATVSRVLSGSAPVTRSTKERVYAAITELNYEPGFSVISEKEDLPLVAVCVGSLSDLKTLSVISGVEDMLSTNECAVLLFNADESDSAFCDTLQSIARTRAVGMVFVECTDLARRHARELPSLPAVLIGGETIVGGRETALVCVDAQRQGAQAAEVLGSCKKLFYVGAQDTVFDSFEKKCRQAEKQVCVVSPEECLAQIERGSGIFCRSSRTALALSARLQHAGLRIPEDVELLCGENTPLNRCAYPTLASVTLNGYQLGITAVQILLQRLQKTAPLPERIAMPPKLISGDSIK